MRLKFICERFTNLYKKPAMLMVTEGKANSGKDELEFDLKVKYIPIIKNYKNSDLIERFKSSKSEAMIIAGLEESDMIQVRAFIFEARKRFDPGHRPLIIIYTKYTIDELWRKAFTGLHCELLQYGRVVLLVGRTSTEDQRKMFRKMGIRFLGESMEIKNYIGHEYE